MPSRPPFFTFLYISLKICTVQADLLLSQDACCVYRDFLHEIKGPVLHGSWAAVKTLLALADVAVLLSKYISQLGIPYIYSPFPFISEYYCLTY